MGQIDRLYEMFKRKKKTIQETKKRAPKRKMIYHLMDCPVCGPFGGSIYFFISSSENEILLMCDECSTVWRNPEELKDGIEVKLNPPDFIIPGTNSTALFPKARWASREEVIKYGWEVYISGEIDAYK